MSNCSTLVSPCDRNQICCNYPAAPNVDERTFCCNTGYACGDDGTCHAALEGREQAFEVGVIFLIVVAIIVLAVCIISLVYQCRNKKKDGENPRRGRPYRSADGDEIEAPEASAAKRPTTAPKPGEGRDAVQIQHSALRMDSISDEEMHRRERGDHDDAAPRSGAAPIQSPPRTEFSETHDPQDVRHDV